jgi:hypothetical protein
MIAMYDNYEEMGLDDVFMFGKHDGLTVEEVIEDDPYYICWCCHNDVVEFDEEVHEMISKKGIS